MSLASDTLAEVAVELSLSSLFHYQYSSLSKTVANISTDAESYKLVLGSIQTLQLRYLSLRLEGRIRLISDCTPLLKRHSNCLEERQYVAVANNKLLDNKPIDVGYLVSSVQLSWSDKWSVPLDQKRVGLSENSLDVCVNQILDILKLSPIKEEDLIVNTADSSYGTPRFLSPLYESTSLVNIVRLRAGMKLWTSEKRTSTGGANGIYGDCYYLNSHTEDKTYTKKGETYQVHQASLYDLPAQEQYIIETKTAKGRPITITLTRWNNLLRRAKKGYSMKEKPLDVIGVVVKDTNTQALIFQRPTFITISGNQKNAINTHEAFYEYQHRFDIEHNFRFQKQHLLLQKYQTPDVQTLDNWLLVVQLANTLLFLAADEVEHICHKWQKYKDKPAQEKQRLSPCQTKKAAQSLFLTFDKTPFLPQKSNKGKGRIKGAIFMHRTLKKVNKKPRKYKKVA